MRAKPIESCIVIDPASGCWLWSGYLNKQGYGRCQRDGRLVMAHRYVYEKYRGPIEAGKQLDHLCRVTSCVNPDHLEQVTNSENVQRGWDARGLRMFCKRGHEVTGDNRHIRRNGRIECKQCRTINHRNYLAKHGVTNVRYIIRNPGVH